MDKNRMEADTARQAGTTQRSSRDADAAFFRPLQTCQGPKRRPLPCPTRPTQENPLDLTNPPIHPMQHLKRLLPDPVATVQIHRPDRHIVIAYGPTAMASPGG
jgi:hypothetical protein